MTASGPTQPIRALAVFVREVYAPGLHLAFSAAWFVSLDAALNRMSGDNERAGWHLLGGTIVFFLVLFYLRVVDEWKDYGYDKVFNPARPLVRGTVSFSDLYRFLAGTAALVLGIHLLFPDLTGGSMVPLAIVIADLAYGLTLVAVERWSAAVRDNMMLNLLLTYPVNVALSIYACSALLFRNGRELKLEHVLVIIAFAFAFLFYEFARKIAFPAQAKPGKRLYSSVLGVYPALVVSFLFAAASVAIMVTLLASRSTLSFLPIFAAVPVVLGLWRFLRSRVSLTPFATVFIGVFYASVALAALW